MIRGKRGISQAMELVITAVVVLLVLFVIVYGIIPKIGTMVQSSSECSEKNNAICVEAGSSCPEGGYETSAYACKDKSNTCCQLSSGSKTDPVLARFDVKQRQALQNPITVTMNKDTSSLTELKFIEGETSTINIKFNSDLPKSAFGPVAIFAIDSVGGDSIYWLNNGIQPVENPFCSTGTQEKDCVPGGTARIQYTPQLFDTYKSLKFNVIILDESKIICTDAKEHQSVSDAEEIAPLKTDEQYIACLKNPKAFSIYDAKELLSGSNRDKYLYDRDYWLASKVLKISTQRKLDITGLSTSWVAEDAISVVTTEKSLENLRIALFNARDPNTLEPYSQDTRVAMCADNSLNFVQSNIKNIAGLTEGQGFVFNINIGGFALGNTNNPSSTLELKYLEKDVPLTFINSKADIKIDKRALVQLAKTQGDESIDFLKSQSLFLCVKADKMEKGVVKATYTAVSQEPLKVDMIPPEITKDDIRVIMPDPIYNFSAAGTYESVKGQPYFYTQYPRIIINCQDSQSGCASYDYFMKTGDFIDVKLDTTDVQGVIIGTIIKFGLNALLEKIGGNNPVDRLCPHLLSSDYRPNAKNIIPFKEEGQAYVCVRVKDKVGNSQIVWTAVWSPENFLKKVAFEALNEQASQ